MIGIVEKLFYADFDLNINGHNNISMPTVQMGRSDMLMPDLRPQNLRLIIIGQMQINVSV